MSLEWRAASVEPGPAVPTATDWQAVDVPGRPAAFAGAEAVAYRTTFDDPRDGDETHVVLVLEGVYAHARVWLDGDPVADHDAYFEPLRIPLQVGDENELVVECRRPEDRFGGIHDTDRVPDADAVPGIWWDARLETYPDPYVHSLQVAPDVDPDGDRAVIRTRARVVTNEPLEDRVTFSLRPAGDARGGGTMEREPVETDPGHAAVDRAVEVRDPDLWWPHDAGDQPRYAVRAKVGDAGRTAVTGLRSVTRDEGGLRINGQRVAPRGVSLLGDDPADVTRAVGANANLVRGAAHVLSPAVYEACDEQGVLVWQDLPLTGPGAFDVERGTDLARRLVRARRRHPSLAALSVHDDPVADPGRGLGDGFFDRLRYRWRAWRTDHDPGPAREVAAEVDAVPTAPVVGPPGVDHDATATFPGWTFGDPDSLSWLAERYGVDGLVAAFGAGSLAEPGATDAPGFDAETHDRRVADGVDASQAYQAGVVGAVAERLRRRDVAALVLSTLRDAGGAGMGILARDGTEKAAYDALATAYEPVQAVLADPSPGESAVVVLHDRPRAATVTVEWDHGGDRQQVERSVEAFGRAEVTTLSLASGDSVTLAVATDDVVAHNEYAI